jgi:hypothetical protein
VPSAATVDAGLVIGWAAMRAGLPIALWSDRALLFGQVRAMRPHYAAYARWFQQPPPPPSPGGGGGAASNPAVKETLPPPTLLGAPRDLVWMIMHVVYVEAEFGLWQLSEDQRADLEPELRFLNGCLAWATAADDFDMLGELLDCLRCAESPTSLLLEPAAGGSSGMAGLGTGDGERSNARRGGGGHDGGADVLQLPTVEMDQAMAHLMARQNADGSWGDPDSPDAVHIAHVCGLALLSRRGNPLLQRKGEGVHIGAPVSNEAFWETASQVMAEGGKDDEM